MDFNNCNIRYPRVLVISNNSFSDTTNNGKTLASFFRKFPADHIAQLYFNPEVPITTRYNNYLRITDNDIVKSLVKRDYKCGNIVCMQPDFKNNNLYPRYKSFIRTIRKYNSVRLAREVLWLSKKWKTKLLDQWLEDFSPEIVFFCAGDSGFAYDITSYIQEKFNAKLVIYVTDDYVMPRKTLSPFWWLRRNYIYNKMRTAVCESDLFITISEKMKKEYNHLLGRNSILAVNMTESLRDESISFKENNILILVYAGGLHFKRYLTLNLLARALKKYNNDPVNKQKVYLKIYSGQQPGYRLLKYLNVKEASEYCGELNAIQLKEVLNSCDITVHVESFNKKCIESTRLSISTKIPEYLSLGKPVLAIGPHEVASMEYLKDCAYCITKQNDIYSRLERLFNNSRLRKDLSKKALLKYEKKHNEMAVSNQFVSSMLSLYDQSGRQV